MLEDNAEVQLKFHYKPEKHFNIIQDPYYYNQMFDSHSNLFIFQSRLTLVP